MKIIGLSGKKQSGKDTVYSIASDILAPPVGRVGFADALKQEVSEATGFRVEFIEEHKTEFRSLLQVWGTDFRRHFSGTEYWIEQMDEVITSVNNKYKYLFITDVRFENEAEFIKQRGGSVIRVERRQQVYKTIQEATVDIDVHVSETNMNDYSGYDYVINNNGSEKDLQKSVRSMLETLNILENAA
jgi:phosphomevalonate kinase